MWIITQDKRQLLKPDRIFCEGGCISCYTSQWQSNTLGEYSSKEKAMKVLNMIQKNIERLEMARITRFPTITLAVVFQMPSDDEVE